MKIIKLLQNPIIKTIGIALVLYFALFHKSDNPNSLSQRLSTERIKEGANQIKDKAKFISRNISGVQDRKTPNLPLYNPTPKKIELASDTAKNVAENQKIDPPVKRKIACGDEVEIIFLMFNEMAVELKRDFIKKLVIGSKQRLYFEKMIIGMEEKSSKDLELFPKDVIEDKEVADIVKKNNAKVKLHIMVNSSKPSGNKNIICK